MKFENEVNYTLVLEVDMEVLSDLPHVPRGCMHFGELSR